MRILLAALLLIVLSSAASAHQLSGTSSAWTAALPIFLVAALILFAWLNRRARLALGEAVTVGFGLAALGLALIWPLPAWEDRSLTAHMIAHELLMVAAAPLLVGVRAWRFGIPAWPFAARRMGAAMKVLVGAENKRILGAAILGISGDEVIHALLDVMYSDAPYTVVEEAMHIHPTVAEYLPTLMGNLEPLQ